MFILLYTCSTQFYYIVLLINSLYELLIFIFEPLNVSVCKIYGTPKAWCLDLLDIQREGDYSASSRRYWSSPRSAKFLNDTRGGATRQPTTAARRRQHSVSNRHYIIVSVLGK